MTLHIRFNLHETEDRPLIEYLSGFRGHDRNRCIRALMRAGLVLAQNGVPPDFQSRRKNPPLTPEPSGLSLADETLSGGVDYVKKLGLDPLAFSFGGIQAGS
jgi:hypothetical protein